MPERSVEAKVKYSCTFGVGREFLDEVHLGGGLVLEDRAHDEVEGVVVDGDLVEQEVLVDVQDVHDGRAGLEVELQDLVEVLALREDVGDHPQLLELVPVDFQRVEEVPVVLHDELLVLVDAQKREVEVGQALFRLGN